MTKLLQHMINARDNWNIILPLMHCKLHIPVTTQFEIDIISQNCRQYILIEDTHMEQTQFVLDDRSYNTSTSPAMLCCDYHALPHLELLLGENTASTSCVYYGAQTVCKQPSV